MKWEFPEPYRRWPLRGAFYFLGLVVVIFFVFTWMGYGNCALPRCWGEPIPFMAALAKLPKIILTVLVATVIGVALMGLRSSN